VGAHGHHTPTFLYSTDPDPQLDPRAAASPPWPGDSSLTFAPLVAGGTALGVGGPELHGWSSIGDPPSASRSILLHDGTQVTFTIMPHS
jgi:hypothetical protein